MNASISVVIPTFNRARLLLEAIQSAAPQMRSQDEIIVVDDGSTDDTAELLRQSHLPVRYLRQENKGPAAARNRGFAAATGEFIAFLDSDDLWAPDRIARQLELLCQHPDLDLVFGLEGLFGDSVQSEAGLNLRDEQVIAALRRGAGEIAPAYSLLLRENFVPTSSTLFRRRFLDRVGGMDEGLWYCDDYDLWLRLAAAGARFGFVAAVGSRRRMHEGNLVRQWEKLATEVLGVLRRQRPADPAVARQLAQRIQDLGYDLGSRLWSRRCHPEALALLARHRPRGVRTFGWAAKMLFSSVAVKFL